MLSHIHTHT